MTVHYHSVVYTSSAVLATASKPTYAKKTVAEPASIPSTPKGKYLLKQKRQVLSNKRPNNIRRNGKQKIKVPSRKFISNPSRLESQVTTSYYDKKQCTYIH